MPSKKSSRQKRYNPNKLLNARMRTITKSILFGWIPGIKGVVTFHLDGKPYEIPADIHNYIMRHPQHWRCLCMVACKTQEGERYIKSWEVVTDGPHLHKDLAPELNIQHKKLIAGANDDHLIAATWVISPGNTEIDVEVAEKIVSQLGVWKLKTGLEWKNG